MTKASERFRSPAGLPAQNLNSLLKAHAASMVLAAFFLANTRSALLVLRHYSRTVKKSKRQRPQASFHLNSYRLNVG